MCAAGRGGAVTEIQKGMPGSPVVVGAIAALPRPTEGGPGVHRGGATTGLGGPEVPYEVAIVGAKLSAMAALAAGFAAGLTVLIDTVLIDYGERIGGCLLSGGAAAYGEDAVTLQVRFALPATVDLRLHTTVLRLVPGTSERPHALPVGRPDGPATLEGIAFRTRDVLDAMIRDTGLPIRQIKVDGGASANLFLMRCLAELLHRAVLTATSPKATAIGATQQAGLHAGIWPDEQAVASLWRQGRRYLPSGDSRLERGYGDWLRAVYLARRWGSG